MDKTTTSYTVGLSSACMCGDGCCMSRNDGFQAVRAACENLQIFAVVTSVCIVQLNLVGVTTRKKSNEVDLDLLVCIIYIV